MRLPIKRKQTAQMLSLPDFSGGLNLRDGISEVLDNQLTECANVWYKDGILKTRPGINIPDNGNGFLSVERFGEGQTVNIHTYSNIKHVIYNKVYSLQTANVSMGTEGYLFFYWVNADGIISLPYIQISQQVGFWVCLFKNFLYCFTSLKEIHKLDVNDSKAMWEDVTSDAYVPKVLIQCNAVASKNVTKEQVMGSGVMVEGFNILSDYYQMSYNSYNPMIVTADNPQHSMRYHLVESVTKKCAGKTVKVVYTLPSGQECIHEVKITDRGTTWVEESYNEYDHFKVTVWKNNVTFWEKYEANEKIEAKIDEGGEDDIVITAPYISSPEEKAKIFEMKRSEWYGGGNSGLEGGTRLFLCGNKSEPSLVVWSDLNNPLYFPESSYFYVGDSSSAVRGFGKQSDLLVIFKNNETWCTTYQQNTNITAETLTTQSLIDITTSVYFPLMQINPTIGCAYPDSVQLCRNRLVWMGSDNKIYTLVNENAYNERSVFCVSEMVNPILENYDASNVTSCDWNGYYCLCRGNKVFLMDYNNYGFTHVASYSKTEDANVKIPWFYWELPLGDYAMVCLDSKMIISYYVDAEIAKNCGICCGEISVDNEHKDKMLGENLEDVESEIFSTLTTKIFDFGLPHIRKNVEQINLQLGNNGGEEIKVVFITENGNEETEIHLDGVDNLKRSAAYVDSKAIFPCIKQVLRFGLKIESKGNLAVDSAIIKFRTTGGAR